MINLVLFGPPGAGKGTQSERITNKYNLVHLSTGDIFRRNIKGETDLGNLAKSYIDKGELVPDEVTINMLKNEVLANSDAKGFIFDGFPRTIPQAEALDKLMEELNSSIDLMVSLDVEDDELVKRLLLRGETSGRPDDSNEEVIRNRISVYKQHTAVAADYYNNQGKFRKVNGVGEIDAIFNDICTVIDEVPAS